MFLLCPCYRSQISDVALRSLQPAAVGSSCKPTIMLQCVLEASTGSVQVQGQQAVDATLDGAAARRAAGGLPGQPQILAASVSLAGPLPLMPSARPAAAGGVVSMSFHMLPP